MPSTRSRSSASTVRTNEDAQSSGASAHTSLRSSTILPPVGSLEASSVETAFEPENGSEEHRARLGEELDNTFNMPFNLRALRSPHISPRSSSELATRDATKGSSSATTPPEAFTPVNTPSGNISAGDEAQEEAAYESLTPPQVSLNDFPPVPSQPLPPPRPLMLAVAPSRPPVPNSQPYISRFWSAMERRRYDRADLIASEADMVGNIQRLYDRYEYEVFLPQMPLWERQRAEGVDPNPDYTNVNDETSLAWEASRYSPMLSNLSRGISMTLRMLPHWALVHCRQGRALAGLNTRELDEEFARRVLLQPQVWPDVHNLMEAAGVLDEMRRYREAGFERVEDERLEPTM